MPYTGRLIDHEAASANLRPLPGVRSAIGMDHENLLVMVDGAEYRNADRIDRICIAMDPLGDTLAIVVNVQDVTSQTRDGAATQSRNCELPDGWRAFLQGKRQGDAIAPEVSAVFRGQQGG